MAISTEKFEDIKSKIQQFIEQEMIPDEHSLDINHKFADHLPLLEEKRNKVREMGLFTPQIPKMERKNSHRKAFQHLQRETIHQGRSPLTKFRKVVDWYADETGKKGLAILVGEAPVSEEITALLRHYLVRPEHDVVSQGCLLTTTMMELQFSEPEIFDYVVKQTEQIRDAIEEYFLTAVRNGRLNRDCDPGALSEYVFTLLQGLRVRSRTSSETADLDRTITTAMGPLRDAETSDQRTH